MNEISVFQFLQDFDDLYVLYIITSSSDVFASEDYLLQFPYQSTMIFKIIIVNLRS